MVQFNLLPDVKIEYIRANRLKQSLITISCLVAAGSVVVAILLYLGVAVAQKKHLDDLSKDLKITATKLSSTPEIDKIITVQNQLNSLPALHADKPASSRLFGYLTQVTPANITITSANVDFALNTISLSGNAKDLLGVNTYVDTLKFTTFKSDVAKVSDEKAFTKVLLTGFTSGEKGATYKIEFTYNPEIFKNQSIVSLSVPKTITTRSNVSKPNALFEADTSTTEGSR